MKQLVVSRPHEYELTEAPLPDFKSDEVLVKVDCCAICASDFEILHGINSEEVVYPIVPGHEWTGQVVKASGPFEHWIGKQVVADNAVPCHDCPACRRGKFHICTHKQEIGFNLNGAYADYLVVPGKNLIEVPPKVDAEHVCLVEPLSVCLHVLRQTRFENDQKVLIVGDGPIGLLSTILAHHLGCQDMILAGHHAERLALAQKWTGATTINTHNVALSEAVLSTFGQKADLILETTGQPSVVTECLAVLERGATLCLVGTYREPVEIDANNIMLSEHSIVGSVSYYRSEMEEVLGWLADGLLDDKQILTHRFMLEDYVRAFEVVEKRQDHVIKACFQKKAEC